MERLKDMEDDKSLPSSHQGSSVYEKSQKLKKSKSIL